jgi:hypothetical protein
VPASADVNRAEIKTSPVLTNGSTGSCRFAEQCLAVACGAPVLGRTPGATGLVFKILTSTLQARWVQAPCPYPGCSGEPGKGDTSGATVATESSTAAHGGPPIVTREVIGAAVVGRARCQLIPFFPTKVWSPTTHRSNNVAVSRTIDQAPPQRPSVNRSCSIQFWN